MCDLDQRRYRYARALDAAELRGHTRAVEETAIASVHKAVAAERAAVVAWLRESAMSDDFDGYEMRLLQERANLIERGDHREEPTPPR